MSNQQVPNQLRPQVYISQNKKKEQILQKETFPIACFSVEEIIGGSTQAGGSSVCSNKIPVMGIDLKQIVSSNTVMNTQ
jgi:hypothetical protein